MISATLFQKRLDASAMLDESYLSELRHPGCSDDDRVAAAIDDRHGRRRSRLRRAVRWVKEKLEWWLRDRDIDRYDKFVDGVNQTRKQTADPVRKSPKKVRFGRATRFMSTGETIYDPRERAMVMGTLSKRRKGK
ncbi:unnamed protein product [Clonostachys rhizophaga]|uniref:Uncharacterized protein n=1 Tax=Clonostachys rhizophaga TaxID=160324 RepID=A0A9N9VSJ5_9HYPO|nr:unnamed protein product [Clonostachys rhizophaga]